MNKINDSSAVCPQDNSHLSGIELTPILNYKNSNHQMMGGYFRDWADITANPTTNKVSYADLPDCLDIAIAFGSGSDAFWTAFKDEYIPFMHERGTKCIRSVNINQFINSSYPNTDEGHQALAQAIADEQVFQYGADGIDVDVETTYTGTNLERVIGVFSALADIMHSANLFIIYDTNQTGNTALFKAVYSKVDYVFEQSYGRRVSGLQNTFNTFKNYILPSQYFIGFSFYEENGAYWRDVTEPLEDSRAYAYATWQPNEGTKGGIFSYAIDRDGVAQGDDTIQPTDYPVTRTLIGVMNP